METLNRLPFKAKKSVFEKLEQIVDIASLSKEERMKYDESIKVYRDSMAVMAYEREEGLREGLEKGLEEGLKKGREEGREEEKRMMARNLKSLSLPIESIMQVTGLSVEEIGEL